MATMYKNASIVTTFEDYWIDTPWEIRDIVYERDSVVVYKARWRHLDVCVKRISLTGADTVDALERELTVLAKCIHPRICQFLGYRIDKQYGYMLFEYMHEGDLRTYIRARAPSETMRARMIMDIAIALFYLHDRRPDSIIHRDLKPENILVARDGTAKVADFGVSCVVYSSHKPSRLWGPTHTGEVGTCTWMAPEVANSKSYGLESDIYSLGLLIFFIWTGHTPFSSVEKSPAYYVQLMYKKIHNTAVLEVDLIEHLEIRELCTQCTSFNPNDRPSAKHVVDKMIAIQAKLC